MVRVVPTESQEQAAVIEWAAALRHRFPCLDMLYASQAGARVSWKQAKKLKREGMKGGLPDLHLPVARGGCHGLWIEMKRVRGGRVSPAQAWWHIRLRAGGYQVTVCRGSGEACATIFNYLNCPPQTRYPSP